MDWNRIDSLVEKYWAGETTVAEERELKEFFRLLPPEALSAPRREAALLFRYYAAAETPQPLGKAFDARLLRQLEARPLAPPSTPRGWLVNWLKVAACLLMVAATVLVSRNEYRKAAETRRLTALETYDDPRRAYEATKKALLLVSARLNTGKAYAGEIRRMGEAEAKVRREAGSKQ
ncbi:MAG: hypothetical protein H7Z75_04925 [Ferruginibacter sp.]|nr:hypothetical protein [Cytophagales bacterium]